MILRRAPLLALLLFAPPALAQDAPVEKATFDGKAMSERFAKNLQPALEKALGYEFTEPVTFQLCTRAKMTQIITEENVQLLGQVKGGPRGAALQEQCEQVGKQMGPMVMAKIDMKTGAINVVPEAFKTLSSITEEWQGIESQRFLDLMLLHEAVHVYQHRTFDLAKFIDGIETIGALKGRMAVIEGHAQHITRQLAKGLELQDMLALFMAVNTEVPASVKDPLLRSQLKTTMANAAFPYLEGQTFFTNLSKKLGYEAAVKRVFAEPPTTLRQVSHFEEYLDPPKGGVDLAAAAQKVAKLLEGDHTVQVVPLPETSIKAALAAAGPEAVDNVMKDYKGAQVAVGSSKTVAGAQTVIALIECSSAESTKAFVDIEKVVSKAKDEQVKASPAYELISVEYEESGDEALPGFYVSKVLQVKALGQNAKVESLIVSCGPVVIEMNRTMQEGGKEETLALAKKVAAVLKGE